MVTPTVVGQSYAIPVEGIVYDGVSDSTADIASLANGTNKAVCFDTTADDNEYLCRICLDTSDNRSDFISPCACKGSSKYVHRECLDKWRSTREDIAFSKCTECLKEYTLLSKVTYGHYSSNMRRLRYTYFVVRDFLIALFATQIVIISLALIIYAIDGKHQLITASSMTLHPRTFYYLCSLSFLLAVIGMSYSLFHCRADLVTCCNLDNNCCHNCCVNNSYNPSYGVVGSSSGPVTFDPCCATCCRGAGCDGCVTCCRCASCDGCADLECTTCCRQCACTESIANEAVVFVIILLVIFAVIGIFVCVFIGSMYVQYVVQRHLHVLNKFTLSKDFIVADLDYYHDRDSASADSQNQSLYVDSDTNNDDVEMNTSIGNSSQYHGVSLGDTAPSAPLISPGQMVTLQRMGLM